jgi:hypothetical protein
MFTAPSYVSSPSPMIASFDVVTEITEVSCGHTLGPDDVRGTDTAGDTLCRDCSAWRPTARLELQAVKAA